MRPSGILGLVLIAVGLIVAVLSWGARCYAQVIPGLAPSGPGCNETATITAAGLLVFVLGIVLTLRGRRSGESPRKDAVVRGPIPPGER